MINTLMSARKLQSFWEKTQQGRSSDKTGLYSRKTRLAALEHNQSYQDASPSIHFFSLIPTPRQTLLRRIMLTTFTRLRLVSDGRRPPMLVLRPGRSGDA